MKQPRAYAFFDVDDTIISIKSMHSFEKYYHLNKKGVSKKENEKQWQSVSSQFMNWYKEGKSREFMNKQYFKSFRGRNVSELNDLVENWWQRQLEKNNNLFISSTEDIIERHKKSNHGVVLVTGSFEEIIKHIARCIEAKHYLCTRLEKNNGHFSGKIINRQMIGQGKADAIMEFLENVGVNPRNCYSYADDLSDLPMLEIVGHPAIVKGNKELEELAKQRNWKILDNKTCKII